MIEVTCNDRVGKKVRVKCNSDDTIQVLKLLIAAQTGTKADKIVLKKGYNVFKDHITLADYEINDGMNLEFKPQNKNELLDKIQNMRKEKERKNKEIDALVIINKFMNRIKHNKMLLNSHNLNEFEQIIIFCLFKKRIENIKIEYFSNKLFMIKNIIHYNLIPNSSIIQFINGSNLPIPGPVGGLISDGDSGVKLVDKILESYNSLIKFISYSSEFKSFYYKYYHPYKTTTSTINVDTNDISIGNRISIIVPLDIIKLVYYKYKTHEILFINQISHKLKITTISTPFTLNTTGSTPGATTGTSIGSTTELIGTTEPIGEIKYFVVDEYSTEDLVICLNNIININVDELMWFYSEFMKTMNTRNVISQLEDDEFDFNEDIIDNELDEPELQRKEYEQEIIRISKYLVQRFINTEYLIQYLVLVYDYLPSIKLDITSYVLYRTNINITQELMQNIIQHCRKTEMFVFSELYSKLLATLSQQEFNQLPISMLTQTSRIILESVYSEIESYTMFVDSQSDSEFIKTCSKLLQILHDRLNVSPEHWLISAIDIDTNININRILKYIPFAIKFETRVRLFQKQIGHPDNFGRKYIKIQRKRVLEDGFHQLHNQNIMKVAIVFVDEHGMPEAGIDGGGVFKEFLTESLKEAFNPDFGLFNSTTDNRIYPATTQYARETTQLQLFSFLGKLLGRALIDGVLVDAQFATFFISKWLKKTSTFNELPSLDPELYKNLGFIKTFQGNLSELGLTMTIDTNEFGYARTIELVPSGSTIPVSEHNKMQYILLMSYWKLNTQLRPQTQAFLNGMSEIFDLNLLTMFGIHELQILVGGHDQLINIEDMKQFTVYGGVFDEEHLTVKLFWQVVGELEQSDLRLLLKFVTSCSRPPLLGFGYLEPRLCIRFAGGDSGSLERLPTSSTCVNLLKLPAYKEASTLKEKLLYSIRAGAGFDMS